MRIPSTPARLAAFLLFVTLAAAALPAAEFDIDSGAILLRRLQLCADCGSALLVTRVHPGVMIRCPDCGRQQARLHDRHLITQAYQLCRVCQAPLDAHGHAPGDAVDCANCRARQILSRDAFLPPDLAGGPGYLPGQPPGNAPKRLLYETGAPNDLAAGSAVVPDPPPGIPELDAPIPVVPIDDQGSAAAPGDLSWLPVPMPPRPPTGTAPHIATEPPAPAAPPPAAPPAPSPDVVEVPAVSVEMFGGKRRAPVAAVGGGVVAKVNGKPITAEAVEAVAGPAFAALRANPEGLDQAALAERERLLRRNVLDRLIDREIAAEEAERLGYKPDASELRRAAARIAPRLAGTGLSPDREAYLELAVEAVRKQLAERAEAVSPEAVREFYQAHKSELLQPRRLALASLTVFRDRHGRADQRDYRAVAQEISAQLEKGARFDELRANYDEFPPPPDESAAPLLPEAHYSEEIQALVANFQSGAVFGPVFMPGLALFGKVTEIAEAKPTPFAEVEKDIRRRLAAEQAQRLYNEWLATTRKRAAVEIF